MTEAERLRLGAESELRYYTVVIWIGKSQTPKSPLDGGLFYESKFIDIWSSENDLGHVPDSQAGNLLVVGVIHLRFDDGCQDSERGDDKQIDQHDFLLCRSSLLNGAHFNGCLGSHQILNSHY